MKIGDLVKNRYNDKVGVITAQIPMGLSFIRMVGIMYSVYVDGLNVLLHETDLEVLW